MGFPLRLPIGITFDVALRHPLGDCSGVRRCCMSQRIQLLNWAIICVLNCSNWWKVEWDWKVSTSWLMLWTSGSKCTLKSHTRYQSQFSYTVPNVSALSSRFGRIGWDRVNREVAYILRKDWRWLEVSHTFREEQRGLEMPCPFEEKQRGPMTPWPFGEE